MIRRNARTYLKARIRRGRLLIVKLVSALWNENPGAYIKLIRDAVRYLPKKYIKLLPYDLQEFIN